MTPERLQQIEDLYHSALEQDPAERAAFIYEACNGDVACEGEVPDQCRCVHKEFRERRQGTKAVEASRFWRCPRVRTIPLD